MHELQITFRFDQAELDKALRFIGATDETLPLIKEDFFTRPAVIDLSKVAEPERRAYHTNGLIAMLYWVQEETSENPIADVTN